MEKKYLWLTIVWSLILLPLIVILAALAVSSMALVRDDWFNALNERIS